MLRFSGCCWLLALSVVAPAVGGTITASGAGPLPGSAQNLIGLNPTEIVGSLSGFNSDVSTFQLQIYDPSNFSAQAINAGPFGMPDTELFLFDSNGLGVYYNDDNTITDTLSCLPSQGMSNPCASGSGGLGPLTAGIYFLAITSSQNLPQDNLFNYLFATGLSTDVLGPNAMAGAIAGWDGNSFTTFPTDNVNYDILLTGTVAPEPSTFLLMSAAAAGLALLKRKRAA